MNILKTLLYAVCNVLCYDVLCNIFICGTSTLANILDFLPVHRAKKYLIDAL